MAIPQPAANPRIHEVGKEPVAQTSAMSNQFLGEPEEGVIPKNNGRGHIQTLAELFSPFEGSDAWQTRGLPSPDTPYVSYPVNQKDCTPLQALRELGPLERLAFNTALVANWAEHCENKVPTGGWSGAWMVYREGAEMCLAYIYRESANTVGMLKFPPDIEIVLPAHHGHIIIVPKRR